MSPNVTTYAAESARVVCYFPYYSKESDFYASKARPELCTHIVYVYSNINSSTFQIMPFEDSIDFQEGEKWGRVLKH